MQVRGDWITSRAASAAPAASFLPVTRRTMRRETNDQERSMQLSENHGRLVASPPEGLKPSHSSGGLGGWHQQRSAFVLHEEHDEFRRFGLACGPPNDVAIIRAF